MTRTSQNGGSTIYSAEKQKANNILNAAERACTAMRAVRSCQIEKATKTQPIFSTLYHLFFQDVVMYYSKAPYLVVILTDLVYMWWYFRTDPTAGWYSDKL